MTRKRNNRALRPWINDFIKDRRPAPRRFSKAVVVCCDKGTTRNGWNIKEIEDGMVFIKAYFTKSAVSKALGEKGTHDDWRTAMLLVREVKLELQHNGPNKQSCEFVLVIDSFVIWDNLSGLRAKNTIHWCMNYSEVQMAAVEFTKELEQKAIASVNEMGDNSDSLSISVLLQEIAEISAECELFSPQSQHVTGVKSEEEWMALLRKPMTVEEFQIPSANQTALNTIKEWDNNYRPPDSSSSSLDKQSSSVEEFNIQKKCTLASDTNKRQLPDSVIEAPESQQDAALEKDCSASSYKEVSVQKGYRYSQSEVSVWQDCLDSVRLSDDESLEMGKPDESLEIGSPDESLEIGSPDESLEIPDESLEIGSPDESLEIGSPDESLEIGSPDAHSTRIGKQARAYTEDHTYSQTVEKEQSKTPDTTNSEDIKDKDNVADAAIGSQKKSEQSLEVGIVGTGSSAIVISSGSVESESLLKCKNPVRKSSERVTLIDQEELNRLGALTVSWSVSDPAASTPEFSQSALYQQSIPDQQVTCGQSGDTAAQNVQMINKGSDDLFKESPSDQACSGQTVEKNVSENALSTRGEHESTRGEHESLQNDTTGSSGGMVSPSPETSLHKKSAFSFSIRSLLQSDANKIMNTKVNIAEDSCLEAERDKNSPTDGTNSQMCSKRRESGEDQNSVFKSLINSFMKNFQSSKKVTHKTVLCNSVQKVQPNTNLQQTNMQRSSQGSDETLPGSKQSSLDSEKSIMMKYYTDTEETLPTQSHMSDASFNTALSGKERDREVIGCVKTGTNSDPIDNRRETGSAVWNTQAHSMMEPSAESVNNVADSHRESTTTDSLSLHTNYDFTERYEQIEPDSNKNTAVKQHFMNSLYLSDRRDQLKKTIQIQRSPLRNLRKGSYEWKQSSPKKMNLRSQLINGQRIADTSKIAVYRLNKKDALNTRMKPSVLGLDNLTRTTTVINKLIDRKNAKVVEKQNEILRLDLGKETGISSKNHAENECDAINTAASQAKNPSNLDIQARDIVRSCSVVLNRLDERQLRKIATRSDGCEKIREHTNKPEIKQVGNYEPSFAETAIEASNQIGLNSQSNIGDSLHINAVTSSSHDYCNEDRPRTVNARGYHTDSNTVTGISTSTCHSKRQSYDQQTHVFSHLPNEIVDTQRKQGKTKVHIQMVEKISDKQRYSPLKLKSRPRLESSSHIKPLENVESQAKRNVEFIEKSISEKGKKGVEIYIDNNPSVISTENQYLNTQPMEYINFPESQGFEPISPESALSYLGPNMEMDSCQNVKSSTVHKNKGANKITVHTDDACLSVNHDSSGHSTVQFANTQADRFITIEKMRTKWTKQAKKTGLNVDLFDVTKTRDKMKETRNILNAAVDKTNDASHNEAKETQTSCKSISPITVNSTLGGETDIVDDLSGKSATSSCSMKMNASMKHVNNSKDTLNENRESVDNVTEVFDNVIKPAESAANKSKRFGKRKRIKTAERTERMTGVDKEGFHFKRARLETVSPENNTVASNAEIDYLLGKFPPNDATLESLRTSSSVKKTRSVEAMLINMFPQLKTLDRKEYRFTPVNGYGSKKREKKANIGIFDLKLRAVKRRHSVYESYGDDSDKVTDSQDELSDSDTFKSHMHGLNKQTSEKSGVSKKIKTHVQGTVKPSTSGISPSVIKTIQPSNLDRLQVTVDKTTGACRYTREQTFKNQFMNEKTKTKEASTQSPLLPTNKQDSKYLSNKNSEKQLSETTAKKDKLTLNPTSEKQTIETMKPNSRHVSSNLRKRSPVTHVHSLSKDRLKTISNEVFDTNKAVEQWLLASDSTQNHQVSSDDEN